MKTIKRILGRFAMLLIVGALGLAGMGRIVAANLATSGAPREADSTANGPDPAAFEELELLLRDVAERDEALTRREAAVALREQDLRVAREEIENALADLEAAEDALERRMFESDSASENDLARLTLIYEGMKPKEAATLFESMTPTFAAGFLARMAPDVAAAVFSQLDPTTAYAVSAVIAGRNADAATAPEPQQGVQP